MCFKLFKGKTITEFKSKIEYFQDGSIKRKYFIDNEGHLQGEYVEYRENGKLWVHCYYKSDQLIKTYKQYYIDGKLWNYHQYN